MSGRIKPEIIKALRDWAEFEQDGGNVEQGAAIDIILDWYEQAVASKPGTLTLAQKGWLYDHPEFQLAGPPRMVKFTESGALYADGHYEKHSGNDVIRMAEGPVAVAIPAALALKDAAQQTTEASP